MLIAAVFLPPALSLPHSAEARHLCDKSRVLDLMLVFVCGGTRGPTSLLSSLFLHLQHGSPRIFPCRSAPLYFIHEVFCQQRALRGVLNAPSPSETLRQWASCDSVYYLLARESVSEVVNHNKTEALQPLSL